MSRHRGILVTGAHRSGSTWVGRMLSHSSEVQYIHEPFNLKCRPGICRAKFSKWYAYVNHETERHSNVREAISKTLNFQYGLGEELSQARNVKDVLRAGRDYWLMSCGRMLNRRPLMKDPLALFSAEWLSKNFNMDVVILIRHPAAFVSSLKVKNWSFPFSHLLNQPALMAQYLEPFESEIREYAVEQKDLVSQAILLWRITHSVIRNYQDSYPDWLYIRHEDLSRNPVEEFSNLYHRLDLALTPKIQQEIEISSGKGNPVETSQNIHNVNRDSAANIWNWKNRLSHSDIQRIYDEVGDLGQFFYRDDDWNLSEDVQVNPSFRIT